MDLILINLIRMIKFINIFKIFIVLLFLSNTTFAHNHFPITTDSKMMIKRGKILYEQNCASCHMINLSGAKNWKGLDEDGHRKAPPLNGTGHTWHHDDKTLHAIIKYGFAKLVKNYEGKMMGFGEKLSDKDIDNILAYIKSYWPLDLYEIQINMSN